MAALLGILPSSCGKSVLNQLITLILGYHHHVNLIRTFNDYLVTALVLVLPPENAHEGREDVSSTVEEQSPAEHMQLFPNTSLALQLPVQMLATAHG